MAFRKTTALLAVVMLSLGAADQVFAEEKNGGNDETADDVTLRLDYEL